MFAFACGLLEIVIRLTGAPSSKARVADWFTHELLAQGDLLELGLVYASSGRTE